MSKDAKYDAIFLVMMFVALFLGLFIGIINGLQEGRNEICRQHGFTEYRNGKCVLVIPEQILEEPAK